MTPRLRRISAAQACGRRTTTTIAGSTSSAARARRNPSRSAICGPCAILDSASSIGIETHRG
jgi:hypothetical protein